MCYESGQSAFLHIQLYLPTNLDHIFVEFLPPSDVILDVLHSLEKSTKFICDKLLSPDGAVLASLRRSPINGGVQFSPLSMLHLFRSAISIEKQQQYFWIQYCIVYKNN